MASTNIIQKVDKKISVFIKRFIFEPKIRFYYLNKLGIFKLCSDEKFLKLKFKIYMGYRLNLDNPETFNEKIQWLKLYDRKQEYIKMVDKYEVKKYIRDIIGEKYIIPTLGVWDHFEDINFHKLPRKFVLKCTHDSGGIIIVKDKDKINKKIIKKKLEKSLKYNFYYESREWPYKNVEPKIIAEKYMENTNSYQNELIDYKLMCFNGKVKCSFTCTNRFSENGVNVTFYDTNWNKMPFERHYASDKKTCNKPKSYEEMVQIAEKLSQDIPFARVDFYEVNGNPYFGEITLYPGAGFEEFTPEEWDKILGGWIELPDKMHVR